MNIAIVETDPEELKPYTKNPRKISDEEMEKLKRSLKQFGFIDPVIARQEDNMVIGGHQRLAAAIEIGMSKVPVIYLAGLTDNDSKLLNVALNKISGEWDNDLLLQLLKDLDEDTFDISGFTEDDLLELELMEDAELEDEDEGSGWDEQNPVIQYQIIFNDEAEQKIWWNYLALLKTQYPDKETVSERLIEAIENGKI
jgi:ParB-like chromosome segregation protein Spo0J